MISAIKIFSFSVIAFSLSIPLLHGQHTSALLRAETAIEEVMELADQDEVNEDSLLFLLDTARKAFLESEDYEAYATQATELAKFLLRVRFSSIAVQWLMDTHADLKGAIGEDYPGRVNLMYQLARGYYFRSDFSQSLSVAKANLVNLDTTSAEYANHLNLIGVLYKRQGKLFTSAQMLEKVLALRKEIYGPEHNLVASAMNNLGITYRNLGLYSDAAQVYEQALAIRNDLLGPDHPDVAGLYVNMGVLYSRKLAFHKSIKYLNEALRIYQLDPKSNEERILEVYNNLAIVYREKGGYQEAESYYGFIIREYEESVDDYPEYIGDAYVNWSNIYGDKNQYDRTIDLLNVALQNYRKVLKPDHPKVVLATNNLGRSLYLNGQYDVALEELTALFDLIKTNEEQKLRFANLNNDLADIFFQKGELPTAQVYNQKALDLQKALFGEKSYRLAYTYNKLAEMAATQGEVKMALSYLQQALAANHLSYEVNNEELPAVEGFIKYDYFIESLLMKAALIAQGGDVASLQKANLYHQLADQVLSKVRDELISKEDKILLSQKISALTEASIQNQAKLVVATKELRYWESAFRLSEKNKSNVLAQSIQANQARHFSGIPDSLIEKEDRLQSDISYYQLALLDEADSLRQSLFQDKLFEAQRAYRQLLEKLEADFSFYHKLKYDRSVPGVAAIQFVLPEKTAMISYYTGTSTLYCFVLTKNDFQVYSSPIDDNFYNQQMGFRKSISYRDDIFYEDYLELGNALYKTLFPFQLAADIESLVIIPDGNLSKLPFEALLTRALKAKKKPDFSNLPYLLKDYNVHYELSATLYYQEKSFESTLEKSGKGLLAFAPVFASPQTSNLFKSEIRDPLASVAGRADARGLFVEGQYVKALPATADEVRSIASVFQEKSQPVSTYLYQQASERGLKSADLEKQQYIHIATHGFINEEQPDLSGLMLYPDTATAEDHILHSGEIYGLNLNADLVVLSACETGLGKIASGEGLLGLSRAFRYAGADHLMVSLWKVEDQATAKLMSSFYKNHLGGADRGFASPLRQTKLGMIQSKVYNHPYYWSPFVLIGSK